jgi:hypothetical protein
LASAPFHPAAVRLAFAVVALLLARSPGVYGVLSLNAYDRVAPGPKRDRRAHVLSAASRGDVLRLFVGQGMRPVVQGAASGPVAASLLLSRL